ncbi:MAG: hypothetical protein Kow0079_01180 [Vicingaceae bacterium]
MKKLLLVILVINIHFVLTAQDNTQTEKGMLSLGGRTTYSIFQNEPGLGMGGQFRIRLSNRVNTEWYADYISSSFYNMAARTDYHIGWSVFFYPFQYASSKMFQPFLEAGHCFDYTEVTNNYTLDSKNRFSSAVQMGLGSHFNLTEKFDVTLKSQYMIHLGTDIHVEKNNEGIVIEKHEGSSLEGHLLITISLNYKIARLWK